MREISFTPEAINDLEGIKEHIDEEFGQKKEKEILKAIMKDIKRLKRYPNTDIKLFERFDIETDYKCIYSHKNYVFYRPEEDTIRIIRVLNEKRDFLYILFGTRMSSDESGEYWDD